MPVARVFLRFLLPAVGLALVMLPGLVSPWEVTPESALPLLVGAWIVTAFGMWLEAAFDADRPIRLAVIGPADLATKLATEMRETKVRGYVVVGHQARAHADSPTPAPMRSSPGWATCPRSARPSRSSASSCSPSGRAARASRSSRRPPTLLRPAVRMIEASAFYEEVLGHVLIGQINSAWFQCIMHPRLQPHLPALQAAARPAVAVPVLGARRR